MTCPCSCTGTSPPRPRARVGLRAGAALCPACCASVALRLAGAARWVAASALSPPRTALLSSRGRILTASSALQVVEDFSKGGCKNGYSRHTDSSVLDYDGAHTPGCPGDQSLEEGELLNLLAPFFNEKATLFLESR